MILWKCCTQYACKSGKLSNGHRTGKGQFSFQSQRKAMLNNVQTTAKLHSSHASKVMLKILQARFQQYMNQTSRCSSWIYKRQRNQRSNCQHPLDHWKSKRIPEKHLLLHWLMPLILWITTNCGKFWKRWEYWTTLPASREICMQVKKQEFKLDMEQQIGSKSGKDYITAVYCHPAYLTSVQSTSCEILS